MPDLTDPRRRSGEESHTKARIKGALFGSSVPARTIGRFRVVGRLGAGGMGEVVAGFDDELERRVAIKLLHREIGVEHASRLRREAKALAKLSHPNVVQIYEVGVHDERLFIAMEHIEGSTLRGWLDEAPRDVYAVIDMFEAAGRGLAAAHAAGMVHRDFKPDNVLVGRDGRPRILDFGLARTEPARRPSRTPTDPISFPDELASTADTQLQASLTATGAILGTPAYMSPEQFRGESTTAATDQFSFCVALWEALYGARPFAGGGIRALALAVCEGRLAVPLDPRGPGRLRTVVARGLAPDPGDRWPDFEALLEALHDIRTAPQRRRRSAALAGAGLVALGAVGWAATRVPESDPDEPATVAEASPCVPASERFGGIWDDATQAALATKFEDAPTRGQRWWAFERALLDDWVATWTRIYEHSCAEEAEQAPDRFILRNNCLDQRMIEIQTRVRLLQELSPEDRAALGTDDYPPFVLPSECDDEDTLRAITLYPSDPRERQAIIDAMVDLRVAEGGSTAAFLSGTVEQMTRTREVFMLAKAVVEQAGFEPSIAEVRFREGNARIVAGLRPDDGFVMLDEAAELAQRAHADALGVFAELRTLDHRAAQDPTVLAAEALGLKFEVWASTLRRVGQPVFATAYLHVMRARHHRARGEGDAMETDLAEATRRAREAYGADSYLLKSTLLGVASAWQEAGKYDRAREASQALVDVIETRFGPDSFHLPLTLSSMTRAAITAGQLDDALAFARRSLDVTRVHSSPDAADVVNAEITLGRVHLLRGEYDETARILTDLATGQRPTIGISLDHWANLELFHTALVGEPDEPARFVAAQEGLYASTSQLAAAMRPLLDGAPLDEAERALAAALAEPEWYAQPRGAALVQHGRVLEALGRPAEAAAAYDAVLAEPGPELNPRVPAYAPAVERVARTRRAALSD